MQNGSRNGHGIETPATSRTALEDAMKVRHVAAVTAALTISALVQPPMAAADSMPIGNYQMNITGRYDFHTWLWAVAACPIDDECVFVVTIPQPVAKAFSSEANALLRAGRYTMIVDDPFGLRCDNVYYGRSIPTRDTYSWDAVTLTGTVSSAFESGCNGEPAGSYTYPFGLVRM
jgi:hypothetical protein